MDNVRPGILADITAQARYLTLSILPGSAPEAVLDRLAELVDGESAVVGIGKPLRGPDAST